MFQQELEALQVSEAVVPHSLGVARGTTAAPGAGVKLLDESTEARIGLPSTLWVGGMHKLVAVVVHLHSAVRANHLVGVGHSSHPCFRDQSRDTCSRPWRSAFAIQMSSFKNLSMRRK